MHFHLRDAVADAAGQPQLGACSHGDAPLKSIHLFLSNLETVALFFPVAVRGEDNMAVSLSIVGLDDDGWGCAEASEDLLHRTFVFGCKRLRKGELQDILDLGKLPEVVREAIVVLDPSIDPIEENDDLIGVQMYPT